MKLLPHDFTPIFWWWNVLPSTRAVRCNYFFKTHPVKRLRGKKKQILPLRGGDGRSNQGPTNANRDPVQ